jgi:hypothetical protein
MSNQGKLSEIPEATKLGKNNLKNINSYRFSYLFSSIEEFKEALYMCILLFLVSHVPSIQGT